MKGIRMIGFRTCAVALGLSVATAVALSGCDSAAVRSAGQTSAVTATASSSRPGPKDVPTACKAANGSQLQLGLVDINEQTAFFTQMNTGAQDVANKAGAKLQIVTGHNDSATQVSAIENLVAKGVNALIIDPVDATALKPAIRAAAAKGIPIVTADGTVDSEPAVSAQVGTGNVEGGKQLGEAFLKISGGKGTVGIVGALNSAIQIQRQDGFVTAIKAGGMNVGNVVDGHNINEDAQTAAENLLTSDPSLKFIYATGEPALNGAIAAVKSQSATGRVSVVGWDLSQASADGIKAGWVKAVIQQDTYGFGYEAAKAAINLACKSGTVSATISVPINIVTPKNLENYLYYLKG